MEKRLLGQSNIAIAPLMLGGNVFGWTADESASFAVLDAFVAGGFNAIDTADVYSMWVPGHEGGESETVLGKWLKRRGRRDDVVIATKVGMWPKFSNIRAETIVAACEDSLRRLQTDFIDLYQSHTDHEDTPPEETLEGYSRLVKAGKVRAIGASNFTAARLQASLDAAARLNLPRYDTLQPHYNLMERDFETTLAPLCLAQKVSVIPYYSLASGFLTGKYRSAEDKSKSPRGGGALKYLNERGLRVLNALDAVAARLGATPAQIALAWLMAKPTIAAPIASATSVEQVTDLMGAARLRLSSEEMAALDNASRA